MTNFTIQFGTNGGWVNLDPFITNVQFGQAEPPPLPELLRCSRCGRSVGSPPQMAVDFQLCAACCEDDDPPAGVLVRR